MWIVANDFEKPERKVAVFLDDFTASKAAVYFDDFDACEGDEELLVIDELDDKFWELFEYDPEGYDWKKLTPADLPDDLTWEDLNENCYYNWEVK